MRPLTDLGNAERLAATHGKDLRYCTGLGWLAWDGRRWTRDDTGEVLRRAKLTVRSIYSEASRVESEERRSAIAKWATASEAAPRIEAMVRLARTERPIAIRVEELDADPWALNAANGTIDLRTGELRPHCRADLITKIAGCSFDAAATCPTWDGFLARVVPDDSVRQFLQRFTGYALTGDVREHILVFAHGPGANGKSTFTETGLALLNDYARTAAPELLLAKSQAAHPTEQADLLGLRLVVCQEVEDGRRWSEVTVKQLTGGDRIAARRMREDFFSFTPTHKLLVAANHKPGVRGTDHAIWRRMRLVPFDVVIPDAEKDPRLPAKLRAELPGILAWAVRGCLDWQRDGLGMPAAVAAATDTYRAEQDVLGQFIDDCCVIETFATVRATGLYQAYTRWALDSGERTITQTRFGRAILERGFVREKDRYGWLYRGLGLRQPGVTGVTGCDPDPGSTGGFVDHGRGTRDSGHNPSQSSRADEEGAL